MQEVKEIDWAAKHYFVLLGKLEIRIRVTPYIFLFLSVLVLDLSDTKLVLRFETN